MCINHVVYGMDDSKIQNTAFYIPEMKTMEKSLPVFDIYSSMQTCSIPRSFGFSFSNENNRKST